MFIRASLAILVLLQASCATMFQSHMRVVKNQSGRGGVIAVPNGLDGGANARAEANAEMARNCGHGRFKIIEEGESVVGSKTRADTRQNEDLWGPKKSTDIHSSDVTEWRLTYECSK